MGATFLSLDPELGSRKVRNLAVPHLDNARAKVLEQKTHGPKHVGVKVDFGVVS